MNMNKKIFDLYDEHNSEIENVPDNFLGPSEKKKELNGIRKVADELMLLASVSVDENYFSTILPRFREAQSKIRHEFSFKKLVLSSTLAFSTIVVMIISFQFVHLEEQPSENQQNEIIVNTVPTVAQDPYIASAEQFSDNIVSDNQVQQEIDKRLYQSLSSSTKTNDYILIKNDNDYDKVISQLDEDELDKVYAQLQKTKIL